jgi:sec-independent protein translocase protein TatC
VLTNLVSLEKLRSVRGYVLIGVFIVAAILTPPDVLSQFSMALPMYLLYEGGILFAAILRRSSPAVEAGEQGSA